MTTSKWQLVGWQLWEARLCVNFFWPRRLLHHLRLAIRCLVL